MTKEKDLYQELLDKGYSKIEIHNALHKSMMEIIKTKQASASHNNAQMQQVKNPFNWLKRMVAGN